MNTPTPDRDEAAEGPVHDLLWRLRARLVTPPPEQQVDADLDRLFAAARDHAHVAPAAHEVEFARPAAITAEDLPQVAHLRGYRVLDRVGKVAAVFVLVVGVGGAVVMRPGFDDSTGIPAILGQDDNNESELFAANADEVAAGEAGLDIDDVESAPDAGEVGEGASGDAATRRFEGSETPVVQDAPAGNTAEGPTDAGAPSSPTGGASGPTDAGSSPSPAPKPSPSEASPEPSPAPTTEPSEDPDGFDGFGGGRLCPAPSDAEGDAAEGEDGKKTKDGADATPNPCPSPTPSEEPADGEGEDPSAEPEDEIEPADEAASTKIKKPKLPGNLPERTPRD
jgi:hypothetical protein